METAILGLRLLAAAYTFQPLDTGWFTSCYPDSVSDDGTVVGYVFNRPDLQFPAKWLPDGSMVMLSSEPGSARGINSDGSICGFQYEFNNYYTGDAFVWSAGGLSHLESAGLFSRSSDIAGEWIAGWVTDLDGSVDATRWRDGSPETLATFNGFDAAALCINSFGLTGGQVGLEPAIWGPNGRLHRPLPGLNGYVLSISDGPAPWMVGMAEGHGLIITNRGNVIIWREGKGAAFGVNTSHDVVGKLNNKAVLWRNGTVHDLENLANVPDGWSLVGATAISDTGHIVGLADFDGYPRGFVLRSFEEDH